MLLQAAGLHSGAVVLVGLLDVVGEPISQKMHQVKIESDFAAMVAEDVALDLAGQVAVPKLVRRKSGVVCSGHHGLFGCEVIPGVIEQIFENLAGDVLCFSGEHGVVEVIDDVDELAMLTVNGRDADGKCLIPEDEWHSKTPAAEATHILSSSCSRR